MPGNLCANRRKIIWTKGRRRNWTFYNCVYLGHARTNTFAILLLFKHISEFAKLSNQSKLPNTIVIYEKQTRLVFDLIPFRRPNNGREKCANLITVSIVCMFDYNNIIYKAFTNANKRLIYFNKRCKRIMNINSANRIYVYTCSHDERAV